MRFFSMPALTIGDSVAPLPIVQGGMGVGISLSGLAAAVANEGGIGVIAANAIGLMEPDYRENGRLANIRALRREIRTARERSKGIIGVNLMVAVNNFQDMLRVVIEEKPDVVFLGAGLPIKDIPIVELRAAKVKVVPIVSSGRAAKLIFKSWEKNYHDIPDAVVVEGPEAGGHLGFKIEQLGDPAYALEKIVPEVVAEVKEFAGRFNRAIPVIAGGGLFTGEDIQRILQLGASGVQMATRFVATNECDADIRFKEAYVNCAMEDITIIKSPVGMPGRAIRNDFLDEVGRGERKDFHCPWRCLESCDAREVQYCISEALNNARMGELRDGFAFCGSTAWRIEKIVPVTELVGELKEQYEEAMVAFYQEEFERFKERLAVAVEGRKALIGARIDQWKEEYDAALVRLAAAKKEYDAAYEQKRLSLVNGYELKVAEFKNGYAQKRLAWVAGYEQRLAGFKKNYEQKRAAFAEEYEKALEKAAALKKEYSEKLADLQAGDALPIN